MMMMVSIIIQGGLLVSAGKLFMNGQPPMLVPQKLKMDNTKE